MAVPGPGRQPGRGSLQEGAAAPEAGHAAGGGPEALREAPEQALRQQRGQQGLTDRVASLSGYAEYVQIYYTIFKKSDYLHGVQYFYIYHEDRGGH